MELHLVVVDHIFSYPILEFWSFYFNPATTRFHFHLYSDIAQRTDELRFIKTGLRHLKYNCFVPSPYLQSVVSEYLDPVNIVLAPLPIADIFFDLPAQPRPKSEKTRIAYVGRFSPDKGVAELIEWWTRNVDLKTKYELHLIGKLDLDCRFSHFPRSQWNRKMKILQEALQRPPDGVKIRKISNRKEMAQFYSQRPLLVTLSTFQMEGYGLAVAEAMAAGCPVIVSDWQGHSVFRKGPLTDFLPVVRGRIPQVKTSGVVTAVEKFRKATERMHQLQKSWALKTFSSQAIGCLLRARIER